MLLLASSRSATVAGVVIATVLSAAVAVVAEAQERDGGLWGTFGWAPGWNLTPPDGITRGRGGYFALGGTLSRRLLLGGEGSAWRRNEATLGGNVTLTSLFYPSTREGFFVKAGLGVGQARADGLLPNNGVAIDSDVRFRTGLGTTLGVGWEIRVNGNFYLSAGVNWMLHLFYDDGNESIRSPNHFLLFQIGPMWH